MPADSLTRRLATSCRLALAGVSHIHPDTLRALAQRLDVPAIAIVCRDTPPPPPRPPIKAFEVLELHIANATEPPRHLEADDPKPRQPFYRTLPKYRKRRR